MAILDRVLARALGGISDDPQERRNLLWLTLANLLSGAGAALFGGELMQGFLTQARFSESQIGLLVGVSPLANALGLLLLMGLADRVRHRIRAYALCLLLTAVLPVATAVLGLLPRSSLGLEAQLLVLCGLFALGGLVTAFLAMLDYPIIARAFQVGIRGRVFATLTTTYSVLAVFIGLLSAGVLKQVPYPGGYAACFAAAAVGAILRAAVYSRMKELPQLAVSGVSRSVLPVAAIVDVLRMKEFQWLGPPHILRGLCSGLASLTVAMGLRHLHLPDHFPGYAASALHAANIAGGIALGFTADRWGAALTTLLADTLMALGLATIMLSPHPHLFLGLYFLATFGAAVEGSSVPLGCINIVPAERLGAFSAARLMVLNGSASVGAMLFGHLFQHYTLAAVFALGGALKLVNAVWFWYVFRLKRPNAGGPKQAVE